MKTALLDHNILLDLPVKPPNGWRYPLVGGTRQRHFDGANSKPRKVLENVPTPTTCPGVLCRGSVHTVLGGSV